MPGHVPVSIVHLDNAASIQNDAILLWSASHEWGRGVTTQVQITHDIDHLGVSDHHRDFIVPRFLVLHTIGFFRRNISFREYLRVLSEITRSVVSSEYDTWDCLDEWLALERRYDVRSTWFVACRPGRGIAYSLENAKKAVKRLRENGCIIGLHSQCRDNPAGLPEEKKLFEDLYGITGSYPLRMHYLARSDRDLAPYVDSFEYDSSVMTEEQFSSPGKFQRPLNIMDGEYCCPVKQNLTFAESQRRTRDILGRAAAKDRTVVVDFHQRSLSHSLPRYREYIHWFYEELRRSKCILV